MKRIIRRATILLAVLVLSAAFFPACFGYNYKVTVDPGELGFVMNDNMSGEYAYGQSFVVDPNYVTFRDDPESGGWLGDRYFYKGLKEAGKDNYNDYNENPYVYPVNDTVIVKKDTMYVAAYGLEATKVKYVVNYVDAQGNTMAPSKTHYGNEGDKPVVAFVYVDGYQPQAYNLTKTLVGDESQNVFTFTYTAIPQGTEPAPGGGGTGGGTGGTGAGGAGGTTVPDGQTPQEMIDLDDGETPLDNIDVDKPSMLPIVVGGGLEVFAVATIAALIYVWRKRGSEA